VSSPPLTKTMPAHYLPYLFDVVAQSELSLRIFWRSRPCSCAHCVCESVVATDTSGQSYRCYTLRNLKYLTFHTASSRRKFEASTSRYSRIRALNGACLFVRCAHPCYFWLIMEIWLEENAATESSSDIPPNFLQILYFVARLLSRGGLILFSCPGLFSVVF